MCRESMATQAIDEIIKDLVTTMLDRGQDPTYILLSAKLYFVLCDIEESPGMTEFCGCHIIVTDMDVECIRVMEGPLESALAITSPGVH